MEKQGVPADIVDSSPPPAYNYGPNVNYPAAGGYPAVPQYGHEQIPLNPGVQNPGYPHPQAAYCTQPQGYGQQQNVVFVQAMPLANPPQDHLGYSIFVTICCCWIIGIFAIIKAIECRTAVSTGDRPTAEIKSRQAKKLANIALGLGIVSVVCSIVLIVVYYLVVLSALHH